VVTPERGWMFRLAGGALLVFAALLTWGLWS
jgi:hypothetical protein